MGSVDGEKTIKNTVLGTEFAYELMSSFLLLHQHLEALCRRTGTTISSIA